jgi:hypothetical protein
MFDNSKVSDISIIKPNERVEGIELVSMKRDKDPQSKSFRSITFTFVQTTTGAQLAHREFAPNRVIAGKTLNDDEFKKVINQSHSRVAHITRAFLDEETFLKIKIADLGLAQIDKMWDDYIAMTGQALGASEQGVAKAKGVVCALKVVYNGKYAALPKIPPFISTLNHPKVFTTNPQYDKYTQAAVMPDQEQQNPLAAAGFGATPTPTDTGHASGF